MRKPKPILESALQTQCVEWFRWRHPQKRIFAIPNGGKRNRFEAYHLKRQGVTAGVPDLFVPEPTQKHHGLFIEMKRMGGKGPSPEQTEMMQALAERGYHAALCYSFEEFQQAVESYMGEG